MAQLFEIQHLVKYYDGKPLLNDISLEMTEGETICLLGASGSGKSTLLRIIAGIEKPDGGTLYWQGNDLAGTPTHQRNFGLMFQNYALFPHLNVWENVAFGLKTRGVQAAAMKAKVDEVLEMVNMLPFAQRKVIDLSGGEQQRVALARTLAIQPRLLLLDEPLAALDRNLSQEVLNDLRKILHQTGIPAIYVTHDQEEALAIADRLAMLMSGTIHQQGTPQEVFSHPKDLTVAKFLGMTNFLSGNLVRAGQHPIIATPLGNFEISWPENDSAKPGRPVTLVLRSAAPGNSTDNHIQGNITDVVFSESGYHTDMETSAGHFKFLLPLAKKVGERIDLVIPSDKILVFPE